MLKYFKLLPKRTKVNESFEKGFVYLVQNDWDDFGFKTSFDMYSHSFDGAFYYFGLVKIGCLGQDLGYTSNEINKLFETGVFSGLPRGFFSLGQDVGYYIMLNKVDRSCREFISRGIGDLIDNNDLMIGCRSEPVFLDSLTRNVSDFVIKNQFKRVLSGYAVLDNFEFKYIDRVEGSDDFVEMDFNVIAESKPSTNVHVLIGRNGAGKTTLLNNMLMAIVNPSSNSSRSFVDGYYNLPKKISDDYFTKVVSVSFSAFDKFLPPSDNFSGVKHFYIGMKKKSEGEYCFLNKNKIDLASDFVDHLRACFNQSRKKDDWMKLIKMFDYDNNFSEVSSVLKGDADEHDFYERVMTLMMNISSGHLIILLILTELVNTVEERTLVLMDEPESHLHPPLLSAFMRAISSLLHDRNGVAIVATHSPVVLQEVPKSCVSKITRLDSNVTNISRLERETFGEGVGILTREVFGLDISKSGFHELIENSVRSGGSFEDILSQYDGQLGTEAKIMLMSLVKHRDAGGV